MGGGVRLQRVRAPGSRKDLPNVNARQGEQSATSQHRCSSVRKKDSSGGLDLWWRLDLVAWAQSRPGTLRAATATSAQTSSTWLRSCSPAIQQRRNSSAKRSSVPTEKGTGHQCATKPVHLMLHALVSKPSQNLDKRNMKEQHDKQRHALGAYRNQVYLAQDRDNSRSSFHGGS